MSSGRGTRPSAFPNCVILSRMLCHKQRMASLFRSFTGGAPIAFIFCRDSSQLLRIVCPHFQEEH